MFVLNIMNVKIAVDRQKFYKVLVGRHVKSLRTTALGNVIIHVEEINTKHSVKISTFTNSFK